MKTIYYNGDILTMEKEQPQIGAVVVEDGRIVSTKMPDSLKGYNIVDLKGAAMLPAFLDSHGHFSGYAQGQLQIPLEEAVTFDEIVHKIQSYIAENNIPAGVWVTGKGYDHNRLTERAHPTALVLDRAAPENPVMISHQSGHMGVFNTAALNLLDITADTPCPSGGVIAVENGAPTGYMEENAFVLYQKKVPMVSIEDLIKAYSAVQDKYASYGITTIQEGMLPGQLLPMYEMLTKDDRLKLDVVGYADIKEADKIFRAFPEHRRRYKNHFKLEGVKTFLDGSPQGRTAWMRQPYAGSDDYCGYNTLTDEQLIEFVSYAVRENLQLLAHCNGDAAAAQLLRVCRGLAADGVDVKRIRPVMIHAQLLGKDQIHEVKRLEIIPSFFVAHVYYWGDVHIRNFGFERAADISPAASALKAGIPFTFHQDAPVIEPDMLETIWCSVNRATKNGVKLDGEAISAAEALRAVTINAAYQYFEEDEKGSICEGKRADFVILDNNPLNVAPMEIKNIRVLETIKDGELIYERGSL